MGINVPLGGIITFHIKSYCEYNFYRNFSALRRYLENYIDMVFLCHCCGWCCQREITAKYLIQRIKTVCVPQWNGFSSYPHCFPFLLFILWVGFRKSMLMVFVTLSQFDKAHSHSKVFTLFIMNFFNLKLAGRYNFFTRSPLPLSEAL